MKKKLAEMKKQPC